MEPGQLDCIAESINTMTYLMLLQQDGLLVRHRVLQRRKRNPWFVDVHWTAVIEDTSDQQHYAVDSWILGNGKPPVIQKLEDWLEKKANRAAVKFQLLGLQRPSSSGSRPLESSADQVHGNAIVSAAIHFEEW
jgi:hypothetical protein